MSHDDFGNERYRVERVLEIVEHAAGRLEGRAYVPLSLLRDAVEFIRASEDAAYDAAQVSAGDPPLSSCIDEHVAARVPLKGMQDALRAMERGEDASGMRFARAAREYVQLRRDHMRADDRLFASAPRPAEPHGREPGVEPVESAGTRRVYERLVEESATLDAGAPAGLPTRGEKRARGK